MKIVIVSGSHRENSQSLKVAKWLANSLENKKYETDVIELNGNPFPLWDDAAWKADSDLSVQVKPYTDRVAAADALILISPEWHGMAAAGLKNFLLYVTAKHAGHKPCLLVGVSASRGGSYPIAELRMSGYKNNRITYIPEHLIVQDAVNVMNSADPAEGATADQYIKKRANYALDVLIAYAKAMKPMREAGGLISPDYPNGM